MSTNVKAMNKCVSAALEIAGKESKLTEVSAGKYANMRINGIMKFKVKQYKVENIGNLSVMTMNMGLMQMATFVFSPFYKDLPLLSLDYMYILGNRKAYLELYDLVDEQDGTYKKWLSVYDAMRNNYKDIPDTTASKAWYEHLLSVVTYKAGKKKDDERLLQLFEDYVKTYMSQAKDYPVMDEEKIAAKKALIKEYSDRLIDEGGISTSFFKKSLGEEVTRDFFDKVFFGTQD